LDKDIDNRDQMISILGNIAESLEGMLKKRQIKGRTITLKLKYYNFKSVTRGITIEEPTNEAETMMKHVKTLLEKTEAGKKKVRLLGISLSNLLDKSHNA
jgi:DNA polymerase-4